MRGGRLAEFDVVVLGSGPGGYVAAIRAGQLGLKTAIVEKAEVGGVCLNWGCIPSKALLRNAEVVGLVQHAEDYGIAFDNVRYDYGKAIDRSRQVVDRLTTGVAFLLKKNNVSYVEGHGRLKDPNAVEVRSSGRTLTTQNVIIATGARFRDLPNLPVDGNVVITSREALALREVPERIVIVGGGATGVEFAYVYSKYGAEVTIVELLPNLVPLEDRDVSVQLERSFRRGGIKSMTGSRVESVEVTSDSARVTVSNDGGESVIECDKVLVAVGTQGNIEDIGLEDAGVATERGFIPVDDQMATNVPGVYAIGDVTGKMLLGPRGIGPGCHGGRVDRRAGAPRPGLRYDAPGDVLPPAGRQLRADRGPSEGTGLLGKDRQVPHDGQRQGPCAGRDRGHGQGGGRRGSGRHPRRAHDRGGGHRAAGRAGHG